ncbi:hypothetical protein PULV_a2906 [Pseudoalteromonas ulvae UL12]|uniref:Ig-like domain-containing protein n=1 Tax=Pseudoalteromonas ulvae TaxID=107327 RepID=UPI001A0EA1D9|nr:Ig-like domain-containing protein [Pseudoalteromonas ulvae]MBE0362303.1 hypothetical protein [Pseudoalteromonas ulvae UL12]
MPLIRLLCITLFSLALAACGGGGSLETETGSNDNYKLVVTMTSFDSGEGISTVSKDIPGKLVATLTKNGQPDTNKLISFTLDGEIGVLDPTAGTAQTNSSGEAQIKLRAGSVAGAGTVTASFSVPGGSNLTVEHVFTSQGDEGDTGGDGDVTISLSVSSTTVSAANPIIVSAALTKDGAVVSNKKVTFTSSLGALSPSSGTVLTDAEGVARLNLTAGNVKGAGTVTATLDSGESESLDFQTQGDDTGVVGDINITMQLVDLDGNEITNIAASKPGRVIATVNGITAPVIVTFESTVGEIPIKTAITDANHRATVDIIAGSLLGAGTITASIETGETGKKLFVVGSSTVIMGSGDPLVEGKAEISLAQISAGGTTVVSVRIVDDQGNLFSEPVDVNFSSSCATLSTPTAKLSTPITTSNGIANSTYLAKGCVGDDPINVTANAGGINLSATGVVNVLPANVGSIEFISASPEKIALLGTGALGGSESSTVIFRVLDTNGNPVNNQVVDFSLNTDLGGITIIPTSGTTDSQGLVQTVVNSGTIATSVRVTAIINGSNPVISSQSSVLVVSTGIPDQDSFSLSASVLNPEGWDIDGNQVEITARLADAFNNPVPDGTAVTFTTEGGSIEPSCTTDNGVCSVKWTSQFPRPEGVKLFNQEGVVVRKPTNFEKFYGQKYGGRATITATAIGEESFPDLNGNGRFDATEMNAFLGTNISGKPYDLKEAFVDHNEDGLYNPSEGGDVNNSGALEEFVDFNNDGLFTAKDNKYNGVLCSIPAHEGCSEQKSLNVRRSLVLVMSGSTGFSTVGDAKPLVMTGENTDSTSFIIADLHNQPMPAGTVISSVATVGSVVAGGEYTWPSTNFNGGFAFSVSVKGEKEPKSGSLIISATTPSGFSTALGSIPITIN